ncbi:hypothetical protein LTR27_003291 [Elasticomyces elasticus]|nr:hypothetical protein LTR27_003291 [Elasticomyces elasticus]
MEPFSTAAAAIGLVGTIVHLVKYLQDVKSALENIDGDIEELNEELVSLQTLYIQLKSECDQQHQRPSLNLKQQELWSALKRTLYDTEVTVVKLDKTLRKIYGDDPKSQGWIDAFKKQHRLKAKTPKIKDWRDSISRYNGKLQIWLQRIDLLNKSVLYNLVQQSFLDLKTDNVQAWHKHNQVLDAITPQVFNTASITALKGIQASLAGPVSTINEFFDTPQAVDSCYIGREEESAILAKSMFSENNGQQQQRRFVVYGVGGSGKTQFCCKFAQDYQQRFWAVFWVDGRSHDQLKQTLSQNVASVGKVSNNHDAALHWLSNQNQRWLLIIDNADDPSIELYDYLPKGGNGYVLITTRNPGFQHLGNVGPRCLKFQELREREASMLLLRAAARPSSSSDESMATKIVHTLGYLALAIAVAGRAIREGVCTFQNYLKHFEDTWAHKVRSRDPGHSRQADDFENKREISVETTFEISLVAIGKQDRRESRDAIQLFRTFAYMHCENVRFEFLKQCVENATKEEQEEKKAQQVIATASSNAPRIPQTWSRCLTNFLIQALDRPPVKTLPDVLHEAREKRSLDETRVRLAMTQLTQYSLAMYNSKTDGWSMHPLVHRWAREGLSTRFGEQLVWCEAAATLITNCVVIGQEDEEVMKYLLPHVDEVSKHQATLEDRMRENRRACRHPLLVFESSSSSPWARKMVKFSIIYVRNGLWQKAEPLQSAAQRFTVKVLGFENHKTRLLTQALAGTLWHLGLSDDSARLLEVLLDNCVVHCGPAHRETYVAKLKLAESRMQQGRVPDAKRLCEEALSGLKQLCGPEDEETLNAMDILAGAILLTGTPGAVVTAQNLHLATLEVRERLLGADHPKTLDSRQFYYSSAFWKGDQDEHRVAETGMTEIVEIRKKKLGHEHPLTLLAILYLARSKVELQDFDSADALINAGLPIAERDLGKDHVAVLFCRYHIGRIRVKQKRWAEARNILIAVTEKQKTTLQGWGRYHYDRIGGLLELAKAHHELGEYFECDEAVAEAVRGFDRITTKQHPWHKKLLADHKQWKQQRGLLPLRPSSP